MQLVFFRPAVEPLGQWRLLFMPQGKHYCWSMSQMHSTVSDQGQFKLSGSYAHLFINVWRIPVPDSPRPCDVIRGSNTAMQMYGFLIRPLIDRLGDQTDPMHSKQAWYADNTSSMGTINELYIMVDLAL